MKNINGFVDKRDYERLATCTPVKFRIYSENDMKPLTEWKEGIAENLSVDGMQCKTFCDDKQIEILTNEYIVIITEFQLADTEPRLKYETKLRYFNTSKDTNFRDMKTVYLGLSFINMDETDTNEISDFIRKKCIYERPRMELVNSYHQEIHYHR